MRKAQLHFGESSSWCQKPSTPAARSLGEAGWQSLPFRKSCPLPYPLVLASCLGAASEARQQHSSNSTPPEPDSWAVPPDPPAGRCTLPKTRAQASNTAARGLAARVREVPGLGSTAWSSFHCAAVRMAGECARTHKHAHTHSHTHTHTPSLAHAEPAGPGEGGGG